MRVTGRIDDVHCPECGTRLQDRVETFSFYCPKCKVEFGPGELLGEALEWAIDDDAEIEDWPYEDE